MFLRVGLWHLFACVHNGLTVNDLQFTTIWILDMMFVAGLFQLGKATESKFCSMNHACFPIRVPLTQVWGCVGYTSVPFGSQTWQWTSLIGLDVDGNFAVDMNGGFPLPG